MKKSPKKNKIKILKSRVWKVVSEYIRRRDRGFCATCAIKRDWQEMDAGHYRHNSERNQDLGGNALWYDERNLHSQCFSCNRMRSGKLDRYSLLLEEKYGVGILQDLEKLYRTPKKWTIEEILNVEKYYKDELKKL